MACVFSPSLGHEHAVAWTEPVFILLVVASLFTLDRFLDTHKEYWIILSAVSASLSILTRHMGVSVIISTLILIAIRKLNVITKIKYVVTYIAIAIPIIGVYILRNFLRYGRFTEPQSGSSFSLSYSIDTLISELTSWVFTSVGSAYLETVSRDFDINNLFIMVSVLVILIALFVYGSYIGQRRGVGWEGKGKKGYRSWGELTTPTVYILVYIVVLFFLLFISDIGGIVPRYLTPIYIPTVVIFAIILDRAIRRILSKLYLLGLYALMGLWITSLAVANYNDINKWRDYGYNQNYYSSRDWIDSETISYLKSNPIVGLIYSNGIRAVYAHMLPKDAGTYFYDLPSYLPDYSIHLDWYRARNIDMNIIWFHGWKAYIPIPLYYDLMTLIEKENLQIIAVLEDGMVFKNSQDFTASDTYSSEATILENILKDASLIIADSMFDMYLDDERLIYINTSCNNTDIENMFLLHIYPVNRSDILESRRNNDLDFNNYDFSFHREGFFFGENCAVIRNLPDYDIKTIRTGQYTDEVQLWVEEFRPE